MTKHRKTRKADGHSQNQMDSSSLVQLLAAILTAVAAMAPIVMYFLTK